MTVPSQVDLLVKNAKIAMANGVIEGCIAVEGGVIVSLCRESAAPRADEVLDVGGRLVLPGVIDAHAHLHDEQFLHREDFSTGTFAAAAGGITTVIEMPLTTPIDRPSVIREKIGRGEALSHVDFSLHAGMMNEENLANIAEISRLGVRSFKVFTCKPYGVGDETILEIMDAACQNSALVNFHAENEGMISFTEKRLRRYGRADPLAHHEARPGLAEEEAITRVAFMAELLGARVHISHVSGAYGVDAVERAKRRGVHITAETCPHYLHFTKLDSLRQGPYLKVNPPLRDRSDIARLWKGLAEGTIDMVTSEHAPGTREEKEVGWSDIWSAWGGLPSIETMLPLLLNHGVNGGLISLERLVRITSLNPAKAFGLYGVKGDLAPGFHADFVVVDLKLERVVSSDHLHYKVGWCPYEGLRLRGWPVLTVLRGKVIYDGESITVRKGYGRFTPMAPIKRGN